MHSKGLSKEKTSVWSPDQGDHHIKGQGKSIQVKEIAKEFALPQGQNKGQCGRKGGTWRRGCKKRLKDSRSQIIEGFTDHSTKFGFYFSTTGRTERALRIFLTLSQRSLKNLLNTSKVAVPFCVPTGHSSCSTSLSTLGMVSLLNFSLCVGCVMISCYYFHFPHD